MDKFFIFDDYKSKSEQSSIYVEYRYEKSLYLYHLVSIQFSILQYGIII